VDVVGNFEVEGQLHISRVLLRDILVLKAAHANKVESKLASSADEPFSAQLAVTDRQAPKLFWIMENGDWTLQLRSVVDPADSPENLESAGSLLLDGLTKAQLRKELKDMARGGRR
jgi:Flp pilus assembly protein CpaB